jgi:hypothetical protein
MLFFSSILPCIWYVMLACSDETRKRHALDNIFIIQIVVIDRYLTYLIFEKFNP